MKCVSCETEINPKWRHAIEQNVCPYCGDSIMEELLKGLLSTLQDTMDKLGSYSAQLNDWLLSNYGFIKTDALDLKDYVSKEVLRDMKREFDHDEFDRKKSIIKIKTEHGEEEEVLVEQIQSNSKTAGFFERAQVTKRKGGDNSIGDDGDMDPSQYDPSDEDVELQPIRKSNKPQTFKTAAEKTAYIKSLKKKIETGAPVVVNERGLSSMIDPSNLDNANPEEVAAFSSMIGDGDIITSALPSSNDDDDFITNRVLAANLAAKGIPNKGGDSGTYNANDVRALQDMHARVKNSNQAFQSGENRGKGGFSRAGS
jgi:hypothetical protein